jgi:hypothetical protein
MSLMLIIGTAWACASPPLALLIGRSMSCATRLDASQPQTGVPDFVPTQWTASATGSH